jgi:hypothetical protein
VEAGPRAPRRIVLANDRCGKDGLSSPPSTPRASVPANDPDNPGVELGATFVTLVLLPRLAFLLWLGGALGLVARRLKDRHPGNGPGLLE